jgi:tetratricopeptide (TPR) repeat protein
VRVLRTLLTIIIGVGVGTFLLHNTDHVTLTYLKGYSTELPLAAVILGAALAGAAPMTILWLVQVISGGLRIRALRNDTKQRQEEHRKIADIESQEHVTDPENLITEVEGLLLASPEERRLQDLRTRLLVRLDRDEEVLRTEIPRIMGRTDPDPATVITIADRLADAGKAPEALALYRKLLQAYPDADVVGSRMLAMAFASGDTGLVASLIERRAPLLSPAEKLAGEIYLAENRKELKPDDRVKTLERLARRHPGEAAVRVALIRTLGAAERLDDLATAAARAYEETNFLAPVREGIDWLVRGGLPHEAIGLLRRLILAHPNRFSLQFQLAQLYLDLEMPGDAASMVEQIGGAASDSVVGEILAGRVALRRGESGKAASYFKRALDTLRHDAPYLCRQCRTPQARWDLRCPSCGGFLTLGTSIGIALQGEDERYGYRHPEITYR